MDVLNETVFKIIAEAEELPIELLETVSSALYNSSLEFYEETIETAKQYLNNGIKSEDAKAIESALSEELQDEIILKHLTSYDIEVEDIKQFKAYLQSIYSIELTPNAIMGLASGELLLGGAAPLSYTIAEAARDMNDKHIGEFYYFEEFAAYMVEELDYFPDLPDAALLYIDLEKLWDKELRHYYTEVDNHYYYN